MNINELNNNLTVLLKEYIMNKGYYNTGALYSSIKFNCVFIDNEFKINLLSKDYINFINDGKFIDSFYMLEKVQVIFSNFLANKITISFDELDF